MKRLFVLSVLLSSIGAAFAASPAVERSFVDTYKKAFEAGDAKTLTSLLYTQGADPQMTDFFKMMLTGDIGGKITSIELKDLDANDKKRAAGGPGPGGKTMKLVLPPVKKLVVASEKKDANGSSKSSNEILIAENDGKLVIPTPMVVK